MAKRREIDEGAIPAPRPQPKVKQYKITYRYAKNRYREVMDDTKRSVRLKPVRDYEQAMHEVIVSADEAGVNGLKWLQAFNDKLFIDGEDNTVRIIKFEPVKEKPVAEGE